MPPAEEARQRLCLAVGEPPPSRPERELHVPRETYCLCLAISFGDAGEKAWDLQMLLTRNCIPSPPQYLWDWRCERSIVVSGKRISSWSAAVLTGSRSPLPSSGESAFSSSDDPTGARASPAPFQPCSVGGGSWCSSFPPSPSSLLLLLSSPSGASWKTGQGKSV